MKSKNLFIALLLIAFFSGNSIYAQQDSIQLQEDLELNEILKFVYQLPPLEEVIERALVVSNVLKGRDGNITVKENELMRIKNDWLNIVSFQGNVGYGNGLLGINQSNALNEVVTNTNSIRFALGVSVNLSPAYWVERKHEINIRKGNLAYANAMKEDAKDFIRKKVTTAYLTLEFYRDIFIKACAGIESNRSTLKIAQKKFLEGEIEISIYNDIELKNNKLILELEKYKLNLKKSYFDLKLMLGGSVLE
jgi:outer membrane protein TolC